MAATSTAPPTLISIAQAAERLGLSTDTVRRRIADGTLPARRVGPRTIRLDARDVDALVRPIPTVSAAPLVYGGASRA